MKKGKITKQIGAFPTDDENKVADYFANLGCDVTFLAVSKIKNVNSPDIKMLGKKWEIKTPRQSGKYTIEHAIQYASKQAAHIIVDLRQCKMTQAKAITKIKKESNHRSVIKTTLVITKSRQLLILKGKFAKMQG